MNLHLFYIIFTLFLHVFYISGYIFGYIFGTQKCNRKCNQKCKPEVTYETLATGQFWPSALGPRVLQFWPSAQGRARGVSAALQKGGRARGAQAPGPDQNPGAQAPGPRPHAPGSRVPGPRPQAPGPHQSPGAQAPRVPAAGSSENQCKLELVNKIWEPKIATRGQHMCNPVIWPANAYRRVSWVMKAASR